VLLVRGPQGLFCVLAGRPQADDGLAGSLADHAVRRPGRRGRRHRHPTQKPLELFTRPLLNHTQQGELVFDPFAGSGTCLIAAEQTGRRCVAVELDPAWCDVIRDRYERLQTASRS
jgi:DNA modification methylase